MPSSFFSFFGSEETQLFSQHNTTTWAGEKMVPTPSTFLPPIPSQLVAARLTIVKSK
jgi:hypothetical protein